MGINSSWNLLAVAVVKAKSLNSLKRTSQTSPHIYIYVYIERDISRGLPKAKPLAVHLQSLRPAVMGPGHWPSKTILWSSAFFFFNIVMTWFLGNYVAMFVNIKL